MAQRLTDDCVSQWVKVKEKEEVRKDNVWTDLYDPCYAMCM